MKIEGAVPQSVSFEPEVQQAQAAAPLNRVEQAKVSERAFAGERGAVESYLFEKFAAIPPEGALTLEVKGKASLGVGVGGGVKVSAERNADGDYLVRVQERGYVSAGELVTAEANVQAAGTYWVRTPEAAADLVAALTEAQVGLGDKSEAQVRSAVYAERHLVRTEFSTALDLHISAHQLIGYVGGEVMGQSNVIIDLDKKLLVVEQGVGGELAKRVSSGLARTGTEVEVMLKLRTETQLPGDVLERLANGTLSVADVLRESKTSHKLIVEGEQQVEAVTARGGLAQVKKLEAELDLHALAAAPLEPSKALHGELEVLTSLDAAGGGQDAIGQLHVRSAIYSVSKRDLFHHDDSHQLQSQVDALRSVAPR